jgi:hypothetical protein
MHIELQSFLATAPGTTGATATAFTVSGGVSDSATMKNSPKAPRIIAWWGAQQSDGFQRLVAPSFHDMINGISFPINGSGGNAPFLDHCMPLGMPVSVQPQETLTPTIAGSATAGDVETMHLLIAYESYPGIDARLIGYDDVLKKMEKLTTIKQTITGAATGYTGSALITAGSDLLKANRDYAVLGIETSIDCGAVWISGPDTGNVRIGVPGDSQRADITGGYWGMLSRAYGMPCVPVINSGNKASTYVGIAQNENNVSPIISLNLALLG